MREAAKTEALLDVRELSVRYGGAFGSVYAVNGVSFSMGRSEVFSLVGESGCGKSTTAHAIARLLDEKRTEVSGKIIFDGQDLLAITRKKMTEYRGRRVGMIFQNPLDSLNPLWASGYQVGEAIALDGPRTSREITSKTEELFKEVMIPDPERRISSYPHELSGGMRQRVMIAMMVSRHPDLLIADEPTTALDVTIQAQILELLGGLRRSNGTSILLITHDFGIVAAMADRVGVMYAGRLVEIGAVSSVFESPRHPYTRKLMQALPNIPKGEGRLGVIQGSVPDLSHHIRGCAFMDRCGESSPACSEWNGRMTVCGDGHLVSCAMLG